MDEFEVAAWRRCDSRVLRLRLVAILLFPHGDFVAPYPHLLQFSLGVSQRHSLVKVNVIEEAASLPTAVQELPAYLRRSCEPAKKLLAASAYFVEQFRVDVGTLEILDLPGRLSEEEDRDGDEGTLRPRCQPSTRGSR